MIRHADWIVDVGPAAGEHGGEILYSGPPDGLARGRGVADRAATCSRDRAAAPRDAARAAGLAAAGRRHAQQPARPRRRVPARRVHDRHRRLRARASRAWSARRWSSWSPSTSATSSPPTRRTAKSWSGRPRRPLGGRIAAGMEAIKRLVRVDQKPIGRTPRSNLATYTGLFDHVRKLFAATKAAQARRYDAGRFSFNVAKGRCETCEGEGFVMVELLFLPSVYAPCPTCHGARYNAKTLEIKYRGKNIADVLGHDGRRGVGVLRRRAARPPRRSTCCARSASATCGSASRRPSCPAARRSGSSSRPSCSARSAATRSTSSTSRRPACTRPTSRS